MNLQIRFTKRINIDKIVLGFILLVAFLVRIWGVNYDLPYIYHPDEPGYITIIQNIFKTGDLNPHFFNYPSLFFYINALAYVPYYLIGKLVGVFSTPSDIPSPISLAMGVTWTRMPTTVLLGRIITILFGTGTVWLVYLIGKQITNKTSVGLLASLILAISPTNVWHSRLITPDTFVTFFAVASFLASILIYQHGKTWQYIIAGICVGLTASSKYNGALIVLTLILGHLFRYGKTAIKHFQIYFGLLFCIVGFLITTPYALLDWNKFIKDLKFEAYHYSTGHPGMEGNALKWYLEYMFQTGGIIYSFSLLEILRGFYFRYKETILLSVFPIAYFAFISSFMVRNDRTFLPITPFLFLLSALFIVESMHFIAGLRSKILNKVSMIILVSFSVIGIISLFSKTVMDNIRLMSIDSRETARVWINSNLPTGAKIAIESYSPFIDPDRFLVKGFVRMIDHEPEWYIEQGFEYLVFSQGMYGRFYREPERYRNEIALYNNMFSRFNLIKLFNDGGYEVRIYKIK